MSITCAFRSIATELLHLNARPHKVQSIPVSVFGTATSAHIHCRYLHASRSHGAKWVKSDHPTQSGADREKKLRERKAKEIGLKDGEIPYNFVRLSTQNTGLSELRRLKGIITEVARLNDTERTKRYHVVLTANHEEPIVKIVDFKEAYQKKREARDRAKNSSVGKVRKEIQLTWVSSEADVETKLDKVKEDLEKGFKVDLVITPARGTKRWPSPEERLERIQQIVTRFQNIAKEWKEQDIQGATVVIYLQGNAKLSVEDEEGDSYQKTRAEKAALKQQRREAQEERIRRKQELEARSGTDNLTNI